MSGSVPRDDVFATRLPLPLAQLYRRASNAKTALDRHHHAYYLAEATLKLAACARIGAALASGLEPRSTLARALEQLCLPSVGHWVGFLREAAEYLSARPDADLLPLAGAHEALLRAGALPAVTAFAERAAESGSDGGAPVSADEARSAARRGILGFFSLIAAYRNQVFGHGAQRVTAFYEELGPLLLDAASEVLAEDCLFGGMTLAVARLAPDASGREVEVEWQGLESGKEVGPAVRHEATVASLAWSPDGERIVTASFDGSARIWSAATRQPLGRVMRHDAEVRELALSPDGENAPSPEPPHIQSPSRSQPPQQRSIPGRCSSGRS